jgi:hypothetical protein
MSHTSYVQQQYFPSSLTVFEAKMELLLYANSSYFISVKVYGVGIIKLKHMQGWVCWVMVQ